MKGNGKNFRIKHALRFDHLALRTSGLNAVAGFVLLLLPVAAAAQVFWSVSDEAGRQNWLFGTVHSEDPRLLEWPEPLVAALTEADRLALELVPDTAMLERMRGAMQSEEGRLEAVLGTVLYRQVVAILVEEYGLAESEVARMRPWAAALTLAMPPAETGMFMDLMLSIRARGAGLEVRALETVDEQIDFLTGIPRADQVELIRHAVAQRTSYREDFEALVGAYLDGDLERLEALADEHLAGLGENIVRHFNEIGLEQRNRRMLDRAGAWLDEGGLIIAVGALHLPGEQGLLALLRERGWRVEPVY